MASMAGTPDGTGRRRVAAWVVTAALIGGAVLALLLGEPSSDPVAPGRPAPGFSLPPVTGGPSLDLASLRGRVVLLNFWATWCKPCEEEMPAMERLHRTLAGESFTLVAVSVDEDPEAIEAFRTRLGLSFPILRDADKRVAASYTTFRYPESFLIDRDGKIVARYIGPRDWDADAYVERIRRLVAGQG
jgi:peroxiredoxin